VDCFRSGCERGVEEMLPMGTHEEMECDYGRRTNGIAVDESNEGLTTIWICEASGVGSRDSAILSELS